MDKRINSSAEKLSLRFSDELDIPTRFKPKKVKKTEIEKKEEKEEKTKINLNSMVEKRFQENINSWENLIRIILSKIESEQAWRFISLRPKIENELKSLTHCKDFLDFTDFFILRRDIENCSAEETGRLAMLHSEFQSKVENKC